MKSFHAHPLVIINEHVASVLLRGEKKSGPLAHARFTTTRAAPPRPANTHLFSLQLIEDILNYHIILHAKDARDLLCDPGLHHLETHFGHVNLHRKSTYQLPSFN